MALKINKTLNDKTGGTVASGTIVKFNTDFPKEGSKMNFGLFCYKSQEDFDAGKASYRKKLQTFPPLTD